MTTLAAPRPLKIAPGMQVAYALAFVNSAAGTPGVSAALRGPVISIHKVLQGQGSIQATVCWDLGPNKVRLMGVNVKNLWPADQLHLQSL